MNLSARLRSALMVTCGLAIAVPAFAEGFPIPADLVGKIPRRVLPLRDLGEPSSGRKGSGAVREGNLWWQRAYLRYLSSEEQQLHHRRSVHQAASSQQPFVRV